MNEDAWQEYLKVTNLEFIEQKTSFKADADIAGTKTALLDSKSFQIAKDVLKKNLKDEVFKSFRARFNTFKSKRKHQVSQVPLREDTVTHLKLMKERWGFESYDTLVEFILAPDKWLLAEMEQFSLSRHLTPEEKAKLLLKSQHGVPRKELINALNLYFETGARLAKKKKGRLTEEYLNEIKKDCGLFDT